MDLAATAGDAVTVQLDVRRLGVVPYMEGLELQRSLVAARQRGETADTLLLLEHPPVITFGSRGRAEHVLDRTGIEVVEDTGRGGDVTYHGPGQRIGYPILLLPEGRRDLHRYLRDVEEVVIRVLADHGIAARRNAGRTGVWAGGAKVAAAGIRVSRWVTSHGFSLNLTRQVHEGFRRIVPCGIADAQVTSLEELLGAAPDVASVDDRIVHHVRQVLV